MSKESETVQPQTGVKPKGWHSRRHQTAEAHFAAREAWQGLHGPEARRQRAKECEAARVPRAPEEQLAVLDERLGKGVGARKERTRLFAQLHGTDTIDTIVVLIDDKMQARIKVPHDASAEDVLNVALENKDIRSILGSKGPEKFFYVPHRALKIHTV